MNKAFQCGGFWAKALFMLFVELMEGDNVNEAYHEILKCHEVSDYRVKSYMLHISEVCISTLPCHIPARVKG